ncbi:MAG: hypothetical protein ERJ67_00015 [Aphanocapsa feldmannii 277cV]|uniref:Chromophore lyase CpcS/CpeS n=1 Tax=Aphanocapsa feldmannii 277cV TaxID=2507553 RepID=A0A524RR38_9CHRO|nr:MAG: hypothetical protein ERJ67_00015 [Aphanocapsa feldmannii 277cV]
MVIAAPTDLFPPRSVVELLQLCVGDWMSLRTLFTLSSQEEGWDASQRGDLKVAWLDPQAASPANLGGLAMELPGGDALRLRFDGAGDQGGFSGCDGRVGEWLRNPDGSLLLRWCRGEETCEERIWFTKPNLRLRVRMVCRSVTGEAEAGAFYSEIRRMRARPPRH